MPSKPRFNVRLLARVVNAIGFPFFVIFFVELVYNVYTLDSLLPVKYFEIVLYIVLLIFLLKIYLIAKYPYEFFKRSEYELIGAYKYRTSITCRDDYSEKIKKKVSEDGFEFAGSIENPYDCSMEVYVRNFALHSKAILLIETDFFTEAMLLEHMPILEKFMSEYTGLSVLKWAIGMPTIIIANRMSLPLQVLLSVKNSYTIKLLYLVPLFRATTGEVYAMIVEGSNAFSKARRNNLTRGVKKNWLMKYVISPEEEPEHVWKDVKWKDIIGEFPRYRDFPVAVHKSLNMWEGGYEEPQVEVDKSL